ncbi:MAG: hypothetical protein J7J92_00590 [Candidatus Aenigmarchaeota archaeon]|nr:hypothetical protein [Candidatus Aenigmarchaeota archaeon]
MFAQFDINLVASFLFVFAVVYAVLIYSAILKQKNINVLLSLVIAFFAVSYQPFVSMITEFMPFASIILVILFFVLFLKKIFDKEKTKGNNEIIAILFILLLVVGSTWGQIKSYLPFASDNILWIIGILAFLLMLYVGTSGEK